MAARTILCAHVHVHVHVHVHTCMCTCTCTRAHVHVHVHVHAHVLWPYRLGPRRCEHDRLTRRRVRRQSLDDELELRSVGRERAGQKKS